MGYIQTTVIILICIGLTTSSLLTFCENDASYCNNPNLYELGSINFGKCNVGYVLQTLVNYIFFIMIYTECTWFAY
jgi:hypothetical protein